MLKRWFPAFGALALLLIAPAAGVGQALTPVGDWLTPSHQTVIHIYACGEALCGRIVTSDTLKANPAMQDVHNPDPAHRDRPVKGLTILWGLKGGPTQWSDGWVYDPRNGAAYRCALKLVEPDRVSLSGCLIHPVCLSQTWKRMG